MHSFRLTIGRSLFVTIWLLAVGILMAIALERDWVPDPSTIDFGVRFIGFRFSLGTVEVHLRDIDLAIWGVLYLVGLVWMVFLVERAAHLIENERAKEELKTGTDLGPAGITIIGEIVTQQLSINPLDPASWYFSETGLLVRLSFVAGIILSGLLAIAPLAIPNSFPSWLDFGQVPSLICAVLTVILFLLVVQGRLRQSLSFLGIYSILFVLLYLLAHWHRTVEKNDVYDLPAGAVPTCRRQAL